jgi:hypothetical protein
MLLVELECFRLLLLPRVVRCQFPRLLNRVVSSRHISAIRVGNGSRSDIAEEGEPEFGAGTTTMRNCEKCMIEGKEQHHHDDQRQGES